MASGRVPRAGEPKRRTFTAAYKVKMLERYDQLEDPRERGVLLRREWLYRSHIEYWRAARDRGALAALSDKPARWPSRSQAEVDSERLRKENEKLALGLARTKAALEVVGKHTRCWKCSPRARVPAARIQGPDSAALAA